MKRFVLFLSVLSLVCGCGTLSQTPEQKLLEQEKIAETVMQKLDAMDYVINVDYMLPLRGRSRSLTSEYYIAVKGSTIESHLPYFGVAYNVPYGGGKVLTFKDDIDEYYDSGLQKDRRTVALKTNNDEDIIVYTMTIFDNGSTTINVHCRNREDINYRGTLNVND